MKLGILFSGGKDSTYACYLAKNEGYEIACLISIFSENKESYMFHTPNINKVKKQAKTMNLPLIVVKTRGNKESEILDLEKAVKIALKKYNIGGIVSGTINSVYQSSRIQKICNKLKIECFNPLWQKDQVELLNELIKNKFDVIISGISAYPLDKSFLGRKIDKKFIEEIIKLNNKYKINPAGEGGEYESFVINCPLFKRKLNVDGYDDFGRENAWIREIKLK
jgi:ABC transporter with metal-binding/Fe-S-binding domain ATP-binding protein